MPVTININNLTLCHKGSNGVSMATIPDVCKTPSPGGPAPIPYPNVALSSDLMKGTTTVEADGGNMCANYGSEFFKSTGDEPGVVGGVSSSAFMKEATWITFSFDVKLEGKSACRLTDKMFHNHCNTVNMAGEIQKDLGVTDTEFCQLCKDCVDEAKRKVAWSKKMQDEYGKAANDPNNKTIADVNFAVIESLKRQSLGFKIGGTTDSSRNVKVNPQQGPCAKLKERSTFHHEMVHKARGDALAKKYGDQTPAYKAAWDNGHDAALDDVKAHGAGGAYMQKFLDECKVNC